MKKVVVGFIVLILVSSFVSAKTITVWLTGVNNEILNVYKELTEESFTKKTGININFTTLSWGDFETRFILAAASGDAPDIGGMGPLFAPELGVRGAIIDLKATFPDFDQVVAKLYPSVFRSLTYRGSVFGVPYDANFSMAAYQRDDILSSYGIKTIDTWDEMRKVLPKLQANGSNMALAWMLSETLYDDANMFMWQHGGDDYTPDLKNSGYDQPNTIRGFVEFAELYTKYKIAREIPQMQGFRDGSLFYFVQEPGWYNNIQMSQPQLAGKWSLVQVPGTIRNGSLNRTSSVAGSSLSIFKTSKNKNEAWEYIKWITSTQVQIELAKRAREKVKGTMILPANLEAIMSIGLPNKDLSTYKKVLAEGTASIYGLVAPRHRRRYLLFATREAVIEGVNPESALLKYAKEHNQEIRQKEKEYARFIEKLLADQRK